MLNFHISVENDSCEYVCVTVRGRDEDEEYGRGCPPPTGIINVMTPTMKLTK